MNGRGDGAPRRFRLLFVCTGNICRSPFARFHTRALLEMRLGARWASWFDVASGGTGAVVGAEMHPLSRAQLGPLAAHPDVAAFRARQLPARDVELADLVLTVSRSHRSAVLELEPRALRSTFTMREFARLLQGVDHAALPADPRERAHALVAAALAERGQGAPVEAEDDAIPDPVQGEVADHAEAAARMHAAIRPLVDAIGAAVPWPARPTRRPGASGPPPGAPGGPPPGVRPAPPHGPVPAGGPAFPPPGQPLPGQPFPGQPLPGQPLPGQALPGQAPPGQAPLGQPWGQPPGQPQGHPPGAPAGPPPGRPPHGPMPPMSFGAPPGTSGSPPGAPPGAPPLPAQPGVGRPLHAADPRATPVPDEPDRPGPDRTGSAGTEHDGAENDGAENDGAERAERTDQVGDDEQVGETEQRPRRLRDGVGRHEHEGDDGRHGRPERTPSVPRAGR